MEKNMKGFAKLAAGLLAGVVITAASTLAYGEELTAQEKAQAEKLAPARAKVMVNKWCSGCHGWNGRSVFPLFPMLAGQSAEYIATQLKSFHNLSQDNRAVTHETMFEQWIYNITGWRKPYTHYAHSDDYKYDDAPRNEERAWDFMKGVARDLDEPTMKALGEYFAAQTATAGRGGAQGDVARGKSLYLDGDANKGLLACQQCHGPDAKGQGPIPRLAGQHADYMLIQMRAIQSGVRNVEQMQALIANLDESDLKAVTAYLQSLN